MEPPGILVLQPELTRAKMVSRTRGIGTSWSVRRRAGEPEAKAAEARARSDRTLKSEDRAAVLRAAKALDEALDLEREVVARIRRETRRAAGLFSPRAATLEEIAGWLDPGEVLILYGLCLDEALALVLTADSGRIVSLGKVADVVAACEALRPDEGGEVRELRGSCGGGPDENPSRRAPAHPRRGLGTGPAATDGPRTLSGLPD